MDKQKTVIHWFRKGLRIHDNPGNEDLVMLSLQPILFTRLKFEYVEMCDETVEDLRWKS